MARVIIDTPTSFHYATSVDILIQHVNRANHLANEHLVALLNEARMRFMDSLDFSQCAIDPRAFINADLAVIYKSEARHRDQLNIEIAATDFNQYGCDFVYKVTQQDSAKLVAIAKTAMLHFDYENNCLAPINDAFKALFSN